MSRPIRRAPPCRCRAGMTGAYPTATGPGPRPPLTSCTSVCRRSSAGTRYQMNSIGGRAQRRRTPVPHRPWPFRVIGATLLVRQVRSAPRHGVRRLHDAVPDGDGVDLQRLPDVAIRGVDAQSGVVHHLPPFIRLGIAVNSRRRNQHPPCQWDHGFTDGSATPRKQGLWHPSLCTDRSIQA